MLKSRLDQAFGIHSLNRKRRKFHLSASECNSNCMSKSTSNNSKIKPKLNIKLHIGLVWLQPFTGKVQGTLQRMQDINV